MAKLLFQVSVRHYMTALVLLLPSCSQSFIRSCPADLKDEMAVYQAIFDEFDVITPDVEAVVVNARASAGLPFYGPADGIRLKDSKDGILSEFRGNQVDNGCEVVENAKGELVNVKYGDTDLAKIEELAKSKGISPLNVQQTIEWYSETESRDEKVSLIALLAASYDIKALRYLCGLLHDHDTRIRIEVIGAIGEYYGIGIGINTNKQVNQQLLREYTPEITSGLVIPASLVKEIHLMSMIWENEIADLVPSEAVRSYVRNNQAARISKAAVQPILVGDGRRVVFATDEFVAEDGGIDWFKIWKGMEKEYRQGSVPYITLSRVGFSRNRETAIVHFSVMAGPLCGGGKLLILERKKSKWHVLGILSGWIS